MPIGFLWLQLAGATVLILASSTFLAKSADTIAFKTGMSRAFIGVVLLGTATSLPELGTGVSSVTLVGTPDLAAGDAFGSNLFNLLIIALMDILWRKGPILNSVSTNVSLVGILSIGLISLAALAILIHQLTSATSTWYISPVSLVLLAAFLGSMYIIFRSERSHDQEDSDQNGNHMYTSASLSMASATYLLSTLVVLVSAIWLAYTGDRIAKDMGWAASYVGTQFLALSTSLPELAASFAAIRINAPDLAISNLLGSNLFNMGFILFIDDLAFTDGVLWSTIAQVHSLSAIMAILMTTVVLLALLNQPRLRPGRFWTVEAVLLIGMYATTSALVFYLD